MRTILLTAALAASAPAFAGGVGIVGHGGLHTEKVAYYLSTDPETNVAIALPDNYLQREAVQVIPQFGIGFEFILGDRDDRVQGVFRGLWSLDLAQSDPADRVTEVTAGSVVSAHRDEVKHVGVASVGLNWMVFGDRDAFQAGLSVHFGSGALTTDHTEFVQGTVGPTISYRLSRPVVAFAEVSYLTRYRKRFSHGAQGMVGMRYMFD